MKLTTEGLAERFIKNKREKKLLENLKQLSDISSNILAVFGNVIDKPVGELIADRIINEESPLPEDADDLDYTEFIMEIEDSGGEYYDQYKEQFNAVFEEIAGTLKQNWDTVENLIGQFKQRYYDNVMDLVNDDPALQEKLEKEKFQVLRYIINESVPAKIETYDIILQLGPKHTAAIVYQFHKFTGTDKPKKYDKVIGEDEKSKELKGKYHIKFFNLTKKYLMGPKQAERGLQGELN